MNILFLGPQGSGKGTQARLVKEKLNMHYLDMGAFLREEAKTNVELNQKLKTGELITDELVIPLVRNYINSNDLYDGLIYDGFPRRVGQLAALQKILAEKGRKLDITVYLSLPEEETVRRLSARRTHKVTGEIYNLITNPPGSEVNDNDLLQRDDDKPDAIRRRLDDYHRETEPLVEELKKATYFIEIDGMKTIEDIHQEVLTKIMEYEKNNN